MVEEKEIKGYIEHINSLGEDDFQDHVQELWERNGLLLEYCELIMEEECEDYEYLLDFHISTLVFLLMEEDLLPEIKDNDWLEDQEEVFLNLYGDVAEEKIALNEITGEKNIVDAFTQLISNDEELNEDEQGLVFTVALFVLYIAKVSGGK